MLNQQTRNILLTCKFNFYSMFPCVYSFSSKQTDWSCSALINSYNGLSMAVLHIFSQKLTRFSLLRYPSVLTWRLRVLNPLLNSLTHTKQLLLLYPNNVYGNSRAQYFISLRCCANPHVTPLHCKHLIGIEEVMQHSYINWDHWTLKSTIFLFTKMIQL